MATVAPEEYIQYQRREEKKRPSLCGSFVLHPKNGAFMAWHTLLTCSIMLTMLLELFMASFDSTITALWALAYSADVIYLINVLLTFFTAYQDEQGITVVNRQQIWKRYLRTNFVVDLLSILPTDILALVLDYESSWKLLTLVRLNRLIRFYKVINYFGRREDELGTNTALLRSLKYLVICTLTTHAMTCSWYSLGCAGEHKGVIKECFANSWADNVHFNVGFDLSTASSLDSYLVSLYWAVATATSTGYGDIYAVNTNEKWMSIGAMLLGIGAFFGMLLGGMTSMLTNFDQQRAAYVHRLDTIREYLRDHDIPEDLREQALGYYEYLWIRKRGVVDSGMLQNLPLTFQAEISHVTNSCIIEKAQIFKDLDTGFLRMLSLNIRPYMYLPNQIIISRGDVGSQMFFIHRGEVDVLSEHDDDTPIATLKSGKLFGEVSLIYSMPRTATIRARTHCDLMVLEKHDLWAMLSHYPEVASRLNKQARDRCNEAEQHNEEQFGSHFEGMNTRKQSFVSHAPENARRRSFATSSHGSSMSMGLHGEKKSFAKMGLEHHHRPSNVIKMSESVEMIREEDNEGPYRSQDILKTNCCEALARPFVTAAQWIADTDICPNSQIYKFWQSLIIGIVLIISIIYPYMACFGAHDYRAGYFDSSLGKGVLSITYILDFLLLFDILVQLRTGIATPHGILTSFSDILHSYAHSGFLFFDIAAAFPLEICCLGWPAGDERSRVFALFRLNRLIKFLKMPNLFDKLEETLDVSILKIRCIKFVLYIGVLSHWVSCVLYTAACYGTSCKSESWIVGWAIGRGEVMDPGNGTATPTTSFSEYIVSLYWAAATMTSTGYGDISAHTGIGRIFSLSAMLLGLLLYGYCLASMAATLANLDQARVKFQEKLFAVKKFMKERKLKQKLQDRVIRYLALLWAKHKGVWMPGQGPILNDMPVGLQQDIAMEDVVDLLAKIPLFRETDDSFLRTLSLLTTLYMFSPKDTIVYSGDIGREMYIVRRGLCEILSPDLSVILAVLGPGQYFGEIGMLFGDYRTATVRAKTHCEVVELKMSDVKTALKDFPLLETDYMTVTKQRSLLSDLQQLTRNKLAEKIARQRGEAAEADGKNVTEGSFKSMVNTGTDLMGFSSSHMQHLEKKSTKPSIQKFKSTDQDYAEPVSKQTTFVRLLSTLLMKKAFLPDGPFLKSWTTIMVVIGLVQAFTVPLQAAFLHKSIFLWVFHYGLDIILYIRLYVRLHVAYYNSNRVLVTHPLFTAKQYLRTNFLIDLLSCFPFELIGLICYPHFTSEGVHLFAILRLNRVISLYQLPLAFTYLESSVEKETGLVREIKFFFYCLIFIHWTTCTVFVLACPPDVFGLTSTFFHTTSGHQCVSGSWITNSHHNLTQAGVGTLYSISLYWGTATAVSVGYGDINANTEVEMLVSLSVMILGVLFFGYIIASVAASLANADAQRARFQEKLRAIRRYMEDQKINDLLQKRVADYYQYVWLRTQGVEPESLFDGLPSALWGDVTLSLYQDIISKISLFEGTEVSFIKMLSKCIKPMLFLKGEYVVRKFDIGSEMFFIHTGAVDVVSEDGNVVFATMWAGAGFGEVALLFSCPRTASIRARVNTDAFVLTKQDLDMALDNYPAIKDQIMRIAEERRLQAQKRSAARVNVQPKPVVEEEEEEEKEAADKHEEENEEVTKVETIKSTTDSSASEEVDSETADETEETKTDRGDKGEAGVLISINSPSPEAAEEEGGENENNNNDDKKEEAADGEDENVPPKPNKFQQLRNLNRFTIDPNNKLIQRYNNVLCVVSILSAWIITYEMTYQDHHVAIITISFICDIFFIINMYLRFHTSFYNEQGDLLDDFDVVFNNYRDSWARFPLDLMVALPLEIFAFAAPSGSRLMTMSYLRLIHILRIMEAKRYFGCWEKELDVNMLVVRLLSSAMNLGIMVHLFSCIWYIIACPLDNCETNTWADVEGPMTPLTAYCTCIYWCVATMTSTGYGDVHAYNVTEMFFASVVMVLGKLMFGFVLGNIASTLANEESGRVVYDKKLDSIKEDMIDQNVPKSLQDRVIGYFDYLWNRKKGQDSKQLLKDCPGCMLAEISMEICKDMLHAIPLFEGAEESFLRLISQKVNQVLFMPGDFIIQRGDVGNELFYITRGEVEVLSEQDPPSVVDDFGPGNLFGEISLVCSIPRRVSVRAKNHCDLLTLSKEDLDEVLEHYPVIASQIQESAEERFGDILEEVRKLSGQSTASVIA